MRHADPAVTLRHYQQAIPKSVRAAAQAMENDLAAAEAALSGFAQEAPAAHRSHKSRPAVNNSLPAQETHTHAAAPSR